MAMDGPEYRRAQEELEELNRRLGYERRVKDAPRQEVTDGGPDIPDEGSRNGAQPAQQPVPAEQGKDPGPPRFIGIDLENGLVGISGGAVIPLLDSARDEVITACLVSLRASLSTSYKTLAKNSGKDPNQLDLFENGTSET